MQLREHCRRIDAAWHARHQDVNGLLNGAGGAPQHEDREEERADRVGAVPIRNAVGIEPAIVERPDESCRHADAEALQDVAKHVRQRGTHGKALLIVVPMVTVVVVVIMAVVMAVVVAVVIVAIVVVVVAVAVVVVAVVMAVVIMTVVMTGRSMHHHFRRLVRWGGVRVPVPMRMAMVTSATAVAMVVTKNPHEDEVHEDADDRDDEHDLPLNDLRRDETKDRLPQQDAGHQPDDEDTCDGAEHLGAVEAEAVLCIRLSAGEHQGDDTHEKPGDIRKHVRGVRHHGQRVGNESTNDLRDHESKAQARADQELALRG
mmetsp:Transcript_5180/g.12034  ORF Transcript_5180/g.12034 Transcript_5180/m.12034 type:complete len:316 (-) Transcript_5180:106-1053(-)